MKKNFVVILTLLLGCSLYGVPESEQPDRSPACGGVYGEEGKNKIRVSITGAVSHPGIYFIESSDADLESLVDLAKPKVVKCPKSGAYHIPALRQIAIFRFFPDEEIKTKKLEVDLKKIEEEAILISLHEGDMIYVGYSMGI